MIKKRKKLKQKKKKIAILNLIYFSKNSVLSIEVKNKLLFTVSTRAVSKLKKTKYRRLVIQHTLEIIVRKLKSLKVGRLIVIRSGTGHPMERSRNHIYKTIKKKFKVIAFLERKNLPFNGCRPPKIRRK